MLGISFFFVFFIIGCLIVYYLRSSVSLAWWIKIVTLEPQCTYFFGPFADAKEAEQHKSGYIEDLQEEGAKGISVEIQQCQQPEQLTIEDEATPVTPSVELSMSEI